MRIDTARVLALACRLSCRMSGWSFHQGWKGNCQNPSGVTGRASSLCEFSCASGGTSILRTLRDVFTSFMSWCRSWSGYLPSESALCMIDQFASSVEVLHSADDEVNSLYLDTPGVGELDTIMHVSDPLVGGGGAGAIRSSARKQGMGHNKNCPRHCRQDHTRDDHRTSHHLRRERGGVRYSRWLAHGRRQQSECHFRRR